MRLVEGALTIEQTTPLPPELLAPEKRGIVSFTIERRSPSIATYALR